MAEEPTSWLVGLGAPMHALRAMSEAQEALAATQARRMGVNTTDMRALRLLDLHGPLGASELGRHLDLRPASVTTLVDRLEGAGLIDRVRGGHDRRRVTVRARPEALRLSYEVWAPVIRAMDRAGADLTPEQQRVVCDYLDRLTATMRRHGEEPDRAGASG